MMTHESYLPEGWADDLRKLGARGLDKMKALYDPATAAKVKADDTAGAELPSGGAGADAGEANADVTV